MTLTLPLAPAIRFHLSLNVAELERSVAFYRTLFGKEPAKHYKDYAKFELDDPPLVLSLAPVAAGAGGALNHLGFRLPDSATLVALQRRLELAGIASRREEGVACCYALQTKFWVTDPDDTLWELYTLEGDLDHHGEGQTLDEMLPGRQATSWEHRLTDAVPETIPLASNSADEVRLRGTLNQPLEPKVQERLVREAVRVLKPGGRLFVHVLVADAPLPSPPRLPGPAAMVSQVPLRDQPARLLEAGGLQRLRKLKFDEAKPCFTHAGVALRELQLEGWKASEKRA